MPTNYHLSDPGIVEGIEMTKSLICWGNNGQSFTQESKITSKSVKEMNNVFGQSGQKITFKQLYYGPEISFNNTNSLYSGLSK